MSAGGDARPRRRHRTEAPNAEGSPFEGYVEHPREGEAVPRRLVVSGWHAWLGEPVAAVVVEAGGVRVAAQPSAARRDDVAADHGGPGYLRCGWHAELELGAVQDDEVTVAVRVFPTDDHGAIELAPIRVAFAEAPTHDEHGEEIPQPDKVVGRLDTPAVGTAVRRGPVSVRGWAATRDGVPAAEVRLELGGVDLGRARIAVDRMDVAAADEAAGAPLSGFEHLVDLTGLGRLDGTVELRARVTALDGTTGELGHRIVLEAPPATSTPSPRRERRAGPPSGADLHLLCCTHDLGIGGAQLWLADVLERSGAGRSYPCTVVAFAPGSLAGRLEALGVEVHVTSPLPVADRTSYEGRLAELDAWLGARPFTAALVNTYRAFGGADLAWRRGLAPVWAIHESWPAGLIWSFDHPGTEVDPEVRAIAEACLAEAGAVVFESNATRRLYEGRTARGVVVPYGVDAVALEAMVAATPRAAARDALGIDEDARVLLMMGTVEARKGQGLAVRAFAEAAATRPEAVLVLVGDLGSGYSRAIGEFVRRAGLAGRVRLEPVTDEPATHYAAADALVVASDVESLPRSVLDSMSVGLPVCSTDVFGLGELLTDGATGLLYPPNDLAAAVGALDRLLAMDRDALVALGSRGRDLVRERHGVEWFVGGVLALLRGLVADPEASPSDLLAAGAPPT